MRLRALDNTFAWPDGQLMHLRDQGLPGKRKHTAFRHGGE